MEKTRFEEMVGGSAVWNGAPGGAAGFFDDDIVDGMVAAYVQKEDRIKAVFPNGYCVYVDAIGRANAFMASANAASDDDLESAEGRGGAYAVDAPGFPTRAGVNRFARGVAARAPTPNPRPY